MTHLGQSRVDTQRLNKPLVTLDENLIENRKLCGIVQESSTCSENNNKMKSQIMGVSNGKTKNHIELQLINYKLQLTGGQLKLEDTKKYRDQRENVTFVTMTKLVTNFTI